MTNGFPWLDVVAGLPALGIVGLLMVPTDDARRAKLLAFLTSLGTLGVTTAMCVAFKTDQASFQFRQSYSWISSFGVHFSLGTDGIALVLIALTAVLTPVVILASWNDVNGGRYAPRTYLALILGLETLMISSFAATDVFLFYVLFEAMLVPMYFVIGASGGKQASYAAVKFLLYSLFGGLLMLASLIGLYVVGARHLPGHHGTFDFTTLTQVHNHISGGVEDWLFLGFFIAFAIKAPLWPLHTWLPDAAAESPTGGAVLLVGVMDKVGTFGFLRYCLPLFPHASKVFAPYILGLAVTGILYGALLAIGQKDFKRLIAYTSVSHFGFIALGIFAFTSQGQSGATFYMVNHGFSTGALFLIIGFLASRRGSRIIQDFGGVAKVAPWLAGAFLIAGLSSLSLPGLSTFVSEFLVLVGTFLHNRGFAVAATFGIILAAIYILYAYQRMMHGPVVRGNEDVTDLTMREAWVIAPVLAIIVFFGCYPKPVLDVINPAVNRTLVQTGSHDPTPPVRTAGPADFGGAR